MSSRRSAEGIETPGMDPADPVSFLYLNRIQYFGRTDPSALTLVRVLGAGYGPEALRPPACRCSILG